jgi:transposase
MQNTKKEFYTHYIALDWSKEIVAMATMKNSGSKVELKTFKPDPAIVKQMLKKCAGKKILTIEETTTSHWLYVELKESVDRILICDPYRNNLMKDGPQTDKIDARNLCLLLRNGMLKEVYHTLDKNYELRKLVSAYEDVVKALVRLKNQRSAMFRAEGKDHKKEKILSKSGIKKFVTQKQIESIEYFEGIKEDFEIIFKKIESENEIIKRLKRISGIGRKIAIMMYSVVIDANRFENKYKYWAYSGLVRYYKESGGKNYGSKKVRYSKLLKKCYKSAALAAINGNNDIREYYEYLLNHGESFENARNQIARYIAKVSYAVMKNNIEYRAYQWRESKN